MLFSSVVIAMVFAIRGVKHGFHCTGKRIDRKFREFCIHYAGLESKGSICIFDVLRKLMSKFRVSKKLLNINGFTSSFNMPFHCI